MMIQFHRMKSKEVLDKFVINLVNKVKLDLEFSLIDVN
jgi:hypothetical protein